MAVIASQLIGKVGLEGSEKTLSGLKQIGEHTEKAESSFKKLREQVARGFEFGTGMQLAQLPGAGLDFLKDQFVDVIKLAMDHQSVMAQTTNVIKTMHDASGQTAEQITALSESIAKVAPVSADAVQAGENMLMTFGNIGKNVFPQTTQAVVDFANFMHMDVTDAALQVGKALNDPATGMANLQREGVRLSPALQQTVKDLEKHGNIAGAQKIVLQELQREFGGSAQAAGKTFAGQLKIAQDKVEELKIKIGTALLPILQDFLGYFEQHILPRLDDFSTWFQTKGIPRLQDFSDWFIHTGIPKLQDFAGIVGTVAGKLGDFVGWLQQGSGPAQAVKLAIEGIGLAIAGAKVAGLVQDMANMATKATDFVAGAGKDLVAFFTGDLQTAADNAGKSVAEIGTSAEGTVAPVAESSAKDVTALDTIGVSAKADAADEVAIGTTAEAEVPIVQGAAMKMSSALGGVALALMNIGESQGAGAVQSQLDKSASQYKYWLQYEWEKVNNFSASAGPMPDFSSMSNDQKMQIFNDWGKTHPGQAFPWLKAQGFASGVTNFEGGLAYVHQNELLVNMPRGTNVIPASTASGGQGGGILHATFVLDGVQFARVIAPYTTDHMRYNLGSVGW